MGTASASHCLQGLLMSCGREGLFTAGYLGIGPVINRTLMENHGLSEATAKVLSCGSAGFAF